jgi:hypothetical protein
VIGSGRLMADISLERLIGCTAHDDTLVNTSEGRDLAELLPLLEQAYFGLTELERPLP